MSDGKILVKVQEQRMGIWPPLSGRNSVDRPALITDLIAAIKAVTNNHYTYTQVELLQYEHLRDLANKIFERFGPRLWPTPDEDPSDHRFSWLAPASPDILEGRYPKDLYYADCEDREVLRQDFYRLVVAKCRRSRGFAPPQMDVQRQPQQPDQADQLNGRIPQHSAGCLGLMSDDDSEDDDDMDDTTDLDYNPTSPHRLRPHATNSYSAVFFQGRSKKRRRSNDAVRSTSQERVQSGVRQLGKHRLMVILKLTPGQLAGVTTVTSNLRDKDVHGSGPVDNMYRTSARPRYSVSATDVADGRANTPEIHASVELSHHRTTPSHSTEPYQLMNRHSLYRLAHEVLQTLIMYATVQDVLKIMSPNCTMEVARAQLADLESIVVTVPAARTDIDVLCHELQQIEDRKSAESLEMRSQSQQEPSEEPAGVIGNTIESVHLLRAISGDDVPRIDLPGERPARLPSSAAAVGEEDGTIMVTPRRVAVVRNADPPLLAVETSAEQHQSVAHDNARPSRPQVNSVTRSDDRVERTEVSPLTQPNGSVVSPDAINNYSERHASELASSRFSKSITTTREHIEASQAGGSISRAAHDATAPTLPSRRTLSDADFAAFGDIEAEVIYDVFDGDKGYIPLDLCRTPEDFFAQIEYQMPPALRHQRIRAVTVERVKCGPDAAPVVYRIHPAAAVASFRALLRRLKHLQAETRLDLRLTIEWHQDKSF
ncbi:hypothetical protein LTR15_010378 [Elasticomyces elasticus]|nr:hypothetical protein LTR15_010378 [Elasticomyces elasticus]